MQRAVPEGVGSMAALISENIFQHNFQPILDKYEVDLANLNSKDQVVISGKKEGVEKAVEEIKQNFPVIDAVFLNVSAPFHSRLMKEIEPEFRDYLMQFPIKNKILPSFYRILRGIFINQKSLLIILCFRSVVL
jgi:[acyl-carrier-protein] S-malonyltransferase